MKMFKDIILWIFAMNLLACSTQNKSHSELSNSLRKYSPRSTSETIDKKTNLSTLSSSPKASMCVRSGTYEVTSHDTFYLADLEGNLPPVNQRKVSVDIFDNCSSHIRLEEIFTVHVDDGQIRIKFSEESLGNFMISQTKVNDCILEFNIRNRGEPYMLAHATFILDYSHKEPTGRAKNLWFLTKLDGELGEHIVSCAADSATLQITSVKSIHNK